jgi:hypothetical protein
VAGTPACKTCTVNIFREQSVAEGFVRRVLSCSYCPPLSGRVTIVSGLPSTVRSWSMIGPVKRMLGTERHSIGDMDVCAGRSYLQAAGL